MTESIVRIGATFRLSPRWAWSLALVGLIGMTSFVALATRLGLLPIAAAMVVAALMAVLSFRWPLLALAAFAAMIPIEEAVRIEGLGTISRLAGILFVVTYGVPRIGRLAFGAMPAAGWAYLAWALVSTGWAISTDAAWGELPTLIQLFAIGVFVADFVAHQPTIVRPILWVYCLSAAATSVVGIQAYATATEGRAAAIQDQNPAQFAALLLPAIIFGLYEVLNGDRRILGGAIALLTTLGVLVSGTRGAWVAVAVVVLLFVIPQLRLRRIVAAVAFAAVLGFVALQLPGAADLVTSRIETAFSSGGAGRTDIWSVAATIYQSAPVLGVGYANFPIAYTPEVVRAANVQYYVLSGSGPHNVVIGTLIELGPIGLLVLALFLGPLVLRRGWGPDAATIQAALVSLLTLALFLDVLGNRKQVWLFIGLAAGLVHLARRARREPAPSAGEVERDAGQPGEALPVAGTAPPPTAGREARSLDRPPVPARHR